jgi:hypothetical protein
MQQQPSESSFPTMKTAGTILMFLMRIFSLPVTVLLHKDYGLRFLGWSGVFALLPFYFVSWLCSTSSSVPLMCLMWAYIARCAIGKALHLYQLYRKRVPKTHTRYSGVPLIAQLLPTWSEDALLWLEPLGVFILGQVAFWLNRPLGYYLCWAAIASAAWRVLIKNYVLNKMLDTHDAAFEQKAFSERFRELQGQ